MYILNKTQKLCIDNTLLNYFKYIIIIPLSPLICISVFEKPKVTLMILGILKPETTFYFTSLSGKKNTPQLNCNYHPISGTEQLIQVEASISFIKRKTL